ncbi:transcriptional repressor CTCF-like isoform X2 [Artemia franciscana]|uniref:transcriptional repressor CTCF-like isoform X2 n=1 Tax=Artemia franciscana TaxID=6661 RepID=UPI0032DAFCEA
MESWQPFEPEVQINPYTLCLPNVTISEVAGSANSNSESENEQNNDDFYIDAVPEVMISDDTERTELFDILNSNKRKRSESEIWQGCCAPGCFSSTANFKKGQKKKSFFQFPDDKEKATDWARRAGILNLIESILTDRKSFHLCSDHFSKEMLVESNEGSQLVPDAVPFEGDEMVSGMIPPPPEVITPKPQRLQPTSVSTPRKKPRVTCHVCGKSLGDAWKLKRHLSSLNKCSSRPWNCGSCEAVYKTELELYDHILTHPEEEQAKAREGMAYVERTSQKCMEYPCLLCGLIFNDKSKLIRHNQRKMLCTAPKGEFHCSECGEIYKKRADWRQHVIDKHTESLVNVSLRVDEGGSEEEASMPQAESADERKVEVWTCSVCQAMFTRLYHLKRHCDTVHKQIDWTGVDWAQFSEKVDRPDMHGTMESGMAYSSEDSVNHATSGEFLSKHGFQCFLCEKTFSRRDHLKRHNDQFHPDENTALKKHICDICDHQARDAWSLKKHKKSHYTPSTSKLKRSWQCELCGVYVSKNVDVTVHMSKHRTELSSMESSDTTAMVGSEMTAMDCFDMTTAEGESSSEGDRPPIKITIRLDKSVVSSENGIIKSERNVDEEPIYQQDVLDENRIVKSESFAYEMPDSQEDMFSQYSMVKSESNISEESKNQADVLQENRLIKSENNADDEEHNIQDAFSENGMIELETNMDDEPTENPDFYINEKGQSKNIVNESFEEEIFAKNLRQVNGCSDRSDSAKIDIDESK